MIPLKDFVVAAAGLSWRKVSHKLQRRSRQSARSALSGGAAALMNAAEVSTKNPFFSLRGPAKALQTASAEGASYFEFSETFLQKQAKTSDFTEK